MSVHLRSNLDAWIPSWVQLFQSPEKVLLSDSLANLLVSLQRELEQSPNHRHAKKTFDPTSSAGGFKRYLVRRLRLALGLCSSEQAGLGADPFSHVIRLHLPEDASAFEAELCRTQVQPARLIPHLRALLEWYRGRPHVLIEHLGQELLKEDALHSGRLEATSRVLAGELLLLDDPKVLARLPERMLTSIGVRAALAPPWEMFLQTAPAIAALQAGAQEVARAAVQSDITALLRAATPESRTLWYADVYSLARSGKAFLSPLGSERDSAIQKDPHICTELGRASLQACAEQILDHALGSIGPPAIDPRDPDTARYTEALSSLVTSAIIPWARTIDVLILGHSMVLDTGLERAFLLGCERLLRLAITKAAAEVFARRLEDAAALRLGAPLASMLATARNECDALGPHVEEGLEAHAARLWAARRDVHKLLQTELRAQLDLLESSLRTSLEQFETPAATSELSNHSIIWGEWPNSVAISASNWSLAPWEKIRWEALPHDVLMAGLRAIGDQYVSERTYDVVFTVQGVQAGNQLWEAGGITWYSGSQLSLGEDIGHSDAIVSLSAQPLRAWLTIKAPSGAAARGRALERTLSTLDAATYALSSGRHAGGLRARIGRSVLTAEVDAGGSLVGGEHGRHELYSVEGVEQAEFQKFIQLYAPLMHKAPSAQTALGRRLVRALAWYREGRWDPNPVTRFLAYYIAVEHLFLAGRPSKQADLPSLAAGLIVSWAWVGPEEAQGLRDITERAEGLRAAAGLDQALTRAMDTVPRLAGWQEDTRTMLVPSAVDDLEKHLSNSEETALGPMEAVSTYREELRRFAGASRTADEGRARRGQEWEHTLWHLKSKRNEIAHEALVTGPEMKLFAGAMEGVLEAILNRTVFLALHRPTVGSIDDAIRWHRTPWIS